jgi:hypothetical protein
MESILKITSNLGYWSKIEDFSEIVLKSDFVIGVIGDNPVLEISKDFYEPKEGDKIYFMPGVNIPRVKFKNLALEKKVKAVRDPGIANIIFANESSIHKISTVHSNYTASTEDFKKLMQDNDFLSKLDERDIENIRESLEFYTNDLIVVDRAIANYLSDSKQFSHSEMGYKTVVAIEDEWVPVIQKCKGKVIYDEGGVVDLLNGDAASVIDADMFKQLSTMFKSSDSDNHILAMEIMANCKYNASLPYLLLLFKDFSHKMYNCHTRNHVNFKSLTGWIGRDILSRNDLDTLCSVLQDKNQYVPEALDIFLNHSHQDILHRGESHYFTIKVITLNPDYAIPGYDYKVKTETEENFNEAIESVIDLVEPIEEVLEEETVSESELNNNEVSETIEVATEEDVVHDLYGVDNDNIEVTLPVETVLINQKIEKNESDDFEWF